MRSKSIYILLTFILFLVFWASVDDVLFYLEVDSESVIYQIFEYGSAILVWITGALLVNQLITIFIWNKLFINRYDSQPPRLLKDITLIILLVLAVTCIVSVVFKKPLTGFWATSGVTAIIIGFALRNMILDLFSGLAINLDSPYKIGDWIQIHQRMATDEIVGEVVDISWRATHVRGEDNTIVVVPNSLMTSMAVITNYYHNNLDTRYEIYFTLDFEVPTERAKRVILAGAHEANARKGFVSSRSPVVLVDKTSDLGITYKVRYWITPWRGISPSTARDEMNSKILSHIWHSGLTLAYPKEDIYYEQMPHRQLNDSIHEDRVGLLSKVKLFSVLTVEEIDYLASKMVKHKFAEGDTIVQQGEEGDSMFVLMEGLLDVKIIDNSDQEIGVGRIRPSHYFGEMSLLTGEKRSASVIAKTESIVYEISKADFIKLIEDRHSVANHLGDMIMERKSINQSSIQSNGEHAFDESEKNKASIVGKIKRFFGLKELTKH